MDTVTVSAEGEFLVRDGKITPVVEAELTDCDGDHYAYTVWVDREDDDEE